MNIKSIVKSERPRERLKEVGPSSLSLEEILAVIIKNGNSNLSAKEVASMIISKVGDIGNLKEITYDELIQIKGIGDAKACEIIASIELGKRIYESVNYNNMLDCCNTENIVKYFKNIFMDKKQEEFYTLYLDKKMKLIKKIRLFIGTVDASITHPREIFKEAYLLSCSYIICIHNHPSGDVTPSKQDKNITKKIVDIGKMHCIPILDHLIIGKDNYFSFYENGMI